MAPIPVNAEVSSTAATYALAVLLAVTASLFLALTRTNDKDTLPDEHGSRWHKYTARHDAAEAHVRAKQVLHETGFHGATLEYMWRKYQRFLPRRKYKRHLTEMYFYLAFVYIHMYPTLEQAPRTLWTRWTLNAERGVTRSTLERHIIPLIFVVATAFVQPGCGEVHWEDRLRWDNHLVYFPTNVTSAIDTAPICVSQPGTKKMSRLLFQPKYGCCVYKMQIVINFLGHIVGYSGLHLGVEPDNKIWRRSVDSMPTKDWELVLGDGIHRGERSILTKYRANQTGDGHAILNAIVDLYRARVEHIMHEVYLYNSGTNR